MLGKRTRSKTGCRTCKIRKVKCDEERLLVEGLEEPQCRRCLMGRIGCDWRSGPIPRKAPKALLTRTQKPDKDGQDRLSMDGKGIQLPLLPISRPPVPHGPGDYLQASNSLTLTGFDRSCLGYLQDSALVVLLGKHWPWCTVSYVYRRVAVKEPMLMSMILATTASEIRRSRLFDCDNTLRSLPVDSLSDVTGRMHYGRALSGLREALKYDVKPPEKLEAIFITLWLMVDYESRFGSGPAGINVHMRGIMSMLLNNVLPAMKDTEALRIAFADRGGAIEWMAPTGNPDFGPVQLAHGGFDERLRSTTVPLFLLWILYFCTPGALFFRGVASTDASLFRFFLHSEPETTPLTLPELYKISRQSPARFWGEEYPATAQLDDLENLPGLNLYHKSHVIQFKITELFKQGYMENELSTPWDESPYKCLIDELITTSEEHDTVLSSARSAPSCEFLGDGRRVMETIYWASITYYSIIVYFYLCYRDRIPEQYTQPRWLSLNSAVSLVLELSLKLHRSRPRLMVRITWPLFMAGIATSDKIYQDWVSIRLRELGRYGESFARVSKRFDQIIQGSDPFSICMGEMDWAGDVVE